MTSPLPGLRRLRIAAGLSQQELADAAGVQQMTVSAIERGAHKDVTVSVLRRLAAALMVDPADLLAEE